MSAPAPSTLDILTGALRKLGVLGAGEDAPEAEDQAVALNEFNGISEEYNLRGRYALFQRTQEFTFTTARQSYSIGATANLPNFVVSQGDRPVKIMYANLVLTDSSPNVLVPIRVINIDQYTQITQPALTSQWPMVIYYQPTVPNGTIWPYLAFPSETSNKLQLTWWDQLLTVAQADIATALVLGPGYRRILELKTALACSLAFPIRTNLEELKRQLRHAESSVQSLNVSPPVISSTDGIHGDRGSTYDWRSGQWI